MQATVEPQSLAAKANEFLDSGRSGPAKPLLAALRRLTPGDPAVAEIAARLAILEGDLRSGKDELDEALAHNPGDAMLLRCRAELLRLSGDLIGAAQDAAAAVIADPTNPTGKAMLGVLMVDVGRPDDGVACLAEAAAAEPAEPSFLEGLARAQAATGDWDAAAATLSEGMAAAPRHVGLRSAAMLLSCRRGRFEEAVALGEAARRDGLADACVFGLTAHALSCLGRDQEAGEAYAEALKLGPADPYVRHLASSGGARPSEERAPAEYLRALFDSYAERFESSLLSLGYRVPGLIRRAIEIHVQLPPDGLYGPVLDLGCGTGLVAVALHGLPVGPIHGVDISRRMLEHAAAKGLYETLRAADILEVLRETSLQYRLILAADVFCYTGDLGPLIAAALKRLVPGGLLIASFEEVPRDQMAGRGWRVGPRGRYAHAASYLEDTAREAGFEVFGLQPERLRLEAGHPVDGRLAVLRRPV